MKHLIVGNSQATLRLLGAVLALILAAQMAKHAPLQAKLPKPGLVLEW